jgi:ankyrin repeat protein
MKVCLIYRFFQSIYGFSSLAVTKNQFKAARLLLKSGANSNAPGPEGQTPLVDAVLNNNTKVYFFFHLLFS